jgi:hypothetical protein
MAQAQLHADQEPLITVATRVRRDRVGGSTVIKPTGVVTGRALWRPRARRMGFPPRSRTSTIGNNHQDADFPDKDRKPSPRGGVAVPLP